MSTQDPRLDRIVAFEGGAARQVVASQVGGLQSKLNVSTRNLAQALTKMRTTASELRAHSGLLPSEKAQRISELQPAAVKAIRDHARVVAAESKRIAQQAATASPVPEIGKLSGHAQQVDLLLAQKFAAMSASQRTALAARCMGDPAANELWTGVLLRTPPELTDIDGEMHSRLRDAAMRTFAPELAATLEIEAEQAAQAQRALDLAHGIVASELPQALAELREPDEPDAPAAPDVWTEELKRETFSKLPPEVRAEFMTRRSDVERARPQ